MTKELESLLGKAHDNIKHALGKKDVRTSMWLIDTVRKNAADRVEAGLLDPLVQAVETFEDIETVSHQALLLAIRGDMTFSQLKAVQDALARHSVLKGVVEIGALRREIESLQAHEGGVQDLGSGHLPSWGKIRAIDADTVEPDTGDRDDPTTQGCRGVGG